MIENKIAEKLSSSNIRSYSLSWGYSGVDPDKHSEDKQYLDSFCKDFVKDTIRLIEQAGLVESVQINTKNYYTWYDETVHHLKFCQTKWEMFCGQEDVSAIFTIFP